MIAIKIAVLAALVIVAHGAPGAVISPGAVTYHAAAPVAAVAAAPLAYHAAPAPVVYSAAAPVTYTATVVKPVEQHGYQIVY